MSLTGVAQSNLVSSCLKIRSSLQRASEQYIAVSTPLQRLSSAPPVMRSPKKQREPRSWCICKMSESAHSVEPGRIRQVRKPLAVVPKPEADASLSRC